MATDGALSRALLDLRRATLAVVVLPRFGGGPFLRRLVGLPPRGPSGPVRLRLALERLGITYLKLGQFLAMRFDVLPAAYCQELGNLFDGVPAGPVETARALVEAELGRPIDQLFAEFDSDALAAGSIAQVHRARTLDGQHVAVKVQRPGIRRIFAADMRNLRRVATLFDAVGGAGFASFRDMVDDFASWTTREMDFTQEGQTADRLRELALDYEVVPAVFWELSTSRVLTLELLDGPNAVQIQKLLDEGGRERLAEAYPTVDLDVVMRRLAFISLRQLFVTGFFHGDPHPGNVIVLADNRVGLIDFGIFGELAPSEREIWRRHFQAFAMGDIREAIYQYERLIVTDPDSDVVAFQREAYLILERLYQAHRDPHTSPAERHIARSSSAVFELLRRHRLRVTLNNLLFWRTLVALNASAFRLSPTFDLIGVQRQFFDAYGPDPIDEAWTVFRDAIAEQIVAVLSGELDRAAQVLALESRGELKLNAVVHAAEPTARNRDRHARALTLALVAVSLAVAGLGSALEPTWRTAMLLGAIPVFGSAILAEARA
ncbi:MAG: AarF/ABC1/UbiB kinase family protein [Chloroflexi bacterium]|nr:AarF/ABC1/UbiB kinase family protein [Chloroflexota bacterium]